MMKVLDIAFKDLLRSFRSLFLLAFMFVVPLLVTGIFYFAFGGLASGGDGFDLPTTAVQVVNLDEPDPQYSNFSAGQTLVDALQSEELANLLQVTVAADGTSARAAVDNQEAGVAIMIPDDFTAAVFDPQRRAAVELYQDPTLTLGPGIVKGIVSQFVDGFAGLKIAANVASDQLARRGVTVDAATLQDIAMQYGNWAAVLGESQQPGTNAWINVRSPAGAEEEGAGTIVRMISMIMSGMMVFFVFFTGAASAQSILQEEEAGTLPRLFTTPTPQSAILGGKLIATFVTLVVQVVVLVAVSSLIFKIDWGGPLPVALVTLGLVVLSASFGIFVMSLLKNTRQTDSVVGGGMTVAGMLGMIGIFTANSPSASGIAGTVSLLVPQGWGVRGWSLLLEGGGVRDVLPTVAVMLVLGVVFFVVGVFKFRKRFA